MSFQKYEQYGKIRSVEYVADAVVDLAELPKSAMGSTCYVIENATTYMCNSRQEWIAQNKSSSGGGGEDIDLSNYMTKSEVVKAISDATIGMIKEEDLITINGESLIGDKDVNIVDLIPDEDITTEQELHTTLTQVMTIEEL